MSRDNFLLERAARDAFYRTLHDSTARSCPFLEKAVESALAAQKLYFSPDIQSFRQLATLTKPPQRTFFQMLAEFFLGPGPQDNAGRAKLAFELHGAQAAFGASLGTLDTFLEVLERTASTSDSQIRNALRVDVEPDEFCEGLTINKDLVIDRPLKEVGEFLQNSVLYLQSLSRQASTWHPFGAVCQMTVADFAVGQGELHNNGNIFTAPINYRIPAGLIAKHILYAIPCGCSYCTPILRSENCVGLATRHAGTARAGKRQVHMSSYFYIPCCETNIRKLETHSMDCPVVAISASNNDLAYASDHAEKYCCSAVIHVLDWERKDEALSKYLSRIGRLPPTDSPHPDHLGKALTVMAQVECERGLLTARPEGLMRYAPQLFERQNDARPRQPPATRASGVQAVPTPPSIPAIPLNLMDNDV